MCARVVRSSSEWSLLFLVALPLLDDKLVDRLAGGPLSVVVAPFRINKNGNVGGVGGG